MATGERGWGPVAAALLIACALAGLSCSSLHVPARVPSFNAEEYARVSRGGVTLEAHPVAGEDAYLELFDDNLPELGIAAIRVVVRNGRDAALSWEKAQWRLQTGSRKYASLNSDGVLRRYHKGRGIRFLTVHAEQRVQERLQAVMFRPSRVGPAESRDGFVFFRTDTAPSAEWVKDARLILRGLRTADGKFLTFDLPLAYAHP